MVPDDVSIAIELLLEAIRDCYAHWGRQKEAALAAGQTDQAHRLTSAAEELMAFRMEVLTLRHSWRRKRHHIGLLLQPPRRKAPTPIHLRHYERTQKEYFRLPLMRALAALDGRAPGREVARRVEAIMKDRLRPADREIRPRIGLPRWRLTLQHCMVELSSQGLIHRRRDGILELTDAGRAWLDEKNNLA